MPFFAIGGIDAGNVDEVLDCRRQTDRRRARDPRRATTRPRRRARCARASSASGGVRRFRIADQHWRGARSASAGGASAAHPGPRRRRRSRARRAPARKSKDDSRASSSSRSWRASGRPPSRSRRSSPALLALSNIDRPGSPASRSGTRSPTVGAVASAGALMLVAAVGHVARALLGGARVPGDPGVPDHRHVAAAACKPRTCFAVCCCRARDRGGAGTLFWFLVKSLARIQMPDRRPPPGIFSLSSARGRQVRHRRRRQRAGRLRRGDPRGAARA